MWYENHQQAKSLFVVLCNQLLDFFSIYGISLWEPEGGGERSVLHTQEKLKLTEVMPSSKRLRIFSFFISVSLHSFDDMEQFVKIVIISIFSDFLGSPTYNYNHFFFPGFFS